MTSENGKYRRINPALTNMIIKLHERGYTEDFEVELKGQEVQHATRNELLFASCSVMIVSQYYDQLLRKYIYLHTAETSWGERGIIVSDAILTGNQSWIIRFDRNNPEPVQTDPTRPKGKTKLKFELI